MDLVTVHELLAGGTSSGMADAMSDDMSDDARKSEKTHILWATNMDDDGYADLLFLVGDKSPYGVGINCGGDVIVKPLREWHRLATLEKG